MIALLAALALTGTAQDPQDAVISTAPPPDPQEAVISTAQGVQMETAEQLRRREAIAYSLPMPRSAPTEDYPLVAWCDAFVGGHVALGESLNSSDDLDQLIISLGRAEQVKFQQALATARPYQSPETLAKADAGRAGAQADWAHLLDGVAADQHSSVFGFFFGLPGRCEHAARRIRENITTPPTTLEEVGIEVEPEPGPGAGDAVAS